ncbi:MAG: molecular chaperone DnaJ [Alphaproteobacteria bacterium]
MPYLILGVGLLFGLYFLVRWFVAANPEDVRKVLTVFGIGVAVLIAGFLLFTGRASLAGALLLGLIPFLLRARGAWRSWQSRAEGRSGRTSTVRTRFLDMALNHDSGALDGTVLAGQFEGQRLSALSGEQLAALLQEVAEDDQSHRILEAYLDRQHGPEWRDGQWRADAGAGAGPGGFGGGGPGGGGSGGGGFGGRGPGGSGRMTVDEARQILGVGPQATTEEIEAAYRAAIKRNHPDTGGSSWLAAKINEARALLLG